MGGPSRVKAARGSLSLLKLKEMQLGIAKSNRSEIVIHGKDGTVRDIESYCDTPNPIKDKKH